MDELMFWIVAAGAAVLVAGTLGLGFLRGQRPGLGGAESDLLVYKDQLEEIDRDVARGILGEEEAETVRLEVKRRLLAADRKAQAAAQSKAGPGLAPAIGLTAAVTLGAIGLYAYLGAPGYADLPLAKRIAQTEAARQARPGQVQAEAQRGPAAPEMSGVDSSFVELMAQLRTALASRPDDLEGHLLLVANETRLGRYDAAWRAQERVIAIKGTEATSDDWAGLAELMVLAAGGYVSPEAEAAADRAISASAENGLALYYKGLADLQAGRSDLAFRIWNNLLNMSDEGDPWVPLVSAELPNLAALAGIPYRPEDAPIFGQNEEMIRGMVEGLAGRLATEGGTAEEWARLIHSLGVLGEHDRAGAIAAEARTVFAADQEAVGMINQALNGSGGR